jgi:hypothetical protein
MENDYAITSGQGKAFRNLMRAFKKCEDAGLYVWDNYGTISAVDGRVVRSVCSDASYGEELNDLHVSYFNSKCWHSSNADDQLYVMRR